MRVRFRVLFKRVLYYIGDLKRDTNLENLPISQEVSVYHKGSSLRNVSGG